MIEQDFQLAGLDRVLSGLARIDNALSSLRPLFELFGKEFYSQEVAWFASEPWVGLTPAYAARKQQRFGSKPLLRATDALFKSLTEQGAAGNIHHVSDLAAEFGTSDFKAGLHRTGTSRMPVRDPFAPPDVDRYEAIAGNYLMQVVTGVFS